MNASTLRTEKGKVLLAAPHDQWTRIERTCVLGTGCYDVRVTIPGQEQREFRNLSCVGGNESTCPRGDQPGQ